MCLMPLPLSQTATAGFIAGALISVKSCGPHTGWKRSLVHWSAPCNESTAGMKFGEPDVLTEFSKYRMYTEKSQS